MHRQTDYRPVFRLWWQTIGHHRSGLSRTCAIAHRRLHALARSHQDCPHQLPVESGKRSHPPSPAVYGLRRADWGYCGSPRTRLDVAIHQRPTGGGDRLWIEKTRLTVQKKAGKGGGMRARERQSQIPSGLQTNKNVVTLHR